MNPLGDWEIFRSGTTEDGLMALDRIRKFVALVVQEAIDALIATDGSDGSEFIAERIFNFGTIALKPLEKAFGEAPNGTLKVILATLLTQLGSKSGIQTLLDSIGTGSRVELLAVNSLVKSKTQDACPLLIQRLDSFEREFYLRPENAPYVNAFIIALERLNCELPSQLGERFKSPEVPKYISHFLK